MQRAVLLAFYNHHSGQLEFTVNDVADWFVALGMAKPKHIKAGKRLVACTDVVRGSHPSSFRLHAKTIQALNNQYPMNVSKCEDAVASTQSVLPDSLCFGTRSVIERLARQINAGYDHGIYDGCAVLMRRLIEILLILSYQHHNIETLVRDSGGSYRVLNDIINEAIQNKTLRLTKETSSCLHRFRELGNFSAHHLHYSCRLADIDQVRAEYRIAVEELLSKSGVKK